MPVLIISERFPYKSVIAAMTAMLLLPQAASAHHVSGNALPATAMEGFLSGLGHPVIGLDHLAFVVGIALLGLLSGARLAAPLVFVVATIGGVGLHLKSLDIAQAELIIAISVGLAALLVMFQVRISAMVLLIAAAMFGVVHGYAYGESIVGAESEALAAYLLGLAIIQAAIVFVAAIAVERLAGWTELPASVWSRATGVAMAAVSVFAIAGALTAV